ncbi:MAG: DUF1223 domain-containing protein [Rhodospirillales bacterium]|nr:DUF1223 domain-containing protein [Rhodospirillales bacterium]
MRYASRGAYAVIVCVLAASAVGVRALAAEPAARPVVIELFTSQGCSSCPPADAFLGELAGRKDVVALALHVDYWDYIGWKDPYAQRAFTERQREYARSLAQRYVYTPQMVVDGRLQGVGSDRAEINRLIAAAAGERKKTAAANPEVKLVPAGDGGRDVRIEGGSFRGKAAVWAAFYDSRHQTSVLRGENRGRNLVDYNVVRELRPLGVFDGRPATLRLEVSETASTCDAGVVVVQALAADGTPSGPIIGAVSFDMPRQPGR